MSAESLFGKPRAPRGQFIVRRQSWELADIGALHVIGSSGEGKSNFLGRMADACMDEGEGVLLIDPKGDLAEDLVRRTRHSDKLIYIAPGAYPDRTFCLNVLEVPRDHPHRTTMQETVGNNLLQMFHHMGKYDPQSMAIISTYLRSAVKTAYTLPNPTLVTVMAILLDEVIRAQFVSTTRRPDIQIFWEYFTKRSKTDKLFQVDSTLRRLWEFIMDVRTYYFIANPTSTLHLADWLDAGKLVVVNLAQGLHEEDTERIGNLMVSYLATQYRLRASSLVPWNRDRRWRLIIDEMHRFAANPVAQTIRDGRAFNFYPVVAHQDMGQLGNYSDNWDVPLALGHASELSFRRSRLDVPHVPPEMQAAFITAQRERRKYEADWTFRGPRGTTTTTLRMEEWNATAKPTAVDEALEQAKQFTLPKSAVPSIRKQLEAWRQGGTMEDHATHTTKSKRKTTADAADSLQAPDTSEAVPDEPDTARDGRATETGPTGLLDLLARRQDVLLGGDDESESEDSAPPPYPGPGA